MRVPKHLASFLMNFIQFFNMFLELWDPKLDTVFQVQCLYCCIEWDSNFCNLLVTFFLINPAKSQLYSKLFHAQFGIHFEAGLLFCLSPAFTGPWGYSTPYAEIDNIFSALREVSAAPVFKFLKTCLA